jgi:hypothetical protein
MILSYISSKKWVFNQEIGTAEATVSKCAGLA